MMLVLVQAMLVVVSGSISLSQISRVSRFQLLVLIPGRHLRMWKAYLHDSTERLDMIA